MANPLMGMMGGAPSANSTNGAMNGNIVQAAQSIKRMMGMLKMAKNPELAFEQAAKQDPMLNAAFQMTKGRDAKAVFYEECQKNGVDPEQVLGMLR